MPRGRKAKAAAAAAPGQAAAAGNDLAEPTTVIADNAAHLRDMKTIVDEIQDTSGLDSSTPPLELEDPNLA